MASSKKKKKIPKTSFEDWSRQQHGVADDSQSEARRKAWKETYNSYYAEDDDIAPVATTTEPNKTYFKESSYFDDGYDLWDVSKTVGSSIADFTEWAAAGIVNGWENLVDAAVGLGTNIVSNEMRQYTSYGNTITTGLSEQEIEENYKKTEKDIADIQKENAEYIAKDTYNGSAIAQSGMRKIGLNPEAYHAGSVFDDKSDALIESAGRLIVSQGVNLVAPGSGLALSGAMAYGGELESALNAGATLDEASMSAAITAIGEVSTELLSGGINFGYGTLDDFLTDKIAKSITSKTARHLLNFGMQTVGEGFEEILSGYVSAVGKQMTYMEEKELNEIFSSEERLDSFIGGAVLGGFGSAGKSVVSNIKGIDSTTGLTKNEQKVLDTEYKNRVAEAEKGGKKLTAKEKSEIYSEAFTALERGEISTDTVEKVLGGDDYKRYTSEVERQEALQKELDELRNTPKGQLTDVQQERLDELKLQMPSNPEMVNTLKSSIDEKIRNELSIDGKRLKGQNRGSYLTESYKEVAKRNQAFNADLSKYKSSAAKQTIKNAIEAGKNGLIYDARDAHDFVDLAARISEDKGYVVEFITSKGLQKQIENGNPYNLEADPNKIEAFVVSGEHKRIFVNLDAKKSLNSLVGHEITDTLRKANAFEALKKAAFAYTQTKGEYDSRLKSTTERYKNIKSANIEGEMVSDIVGDYLFTDYDFIRDLSANHRNIFQQIWDEVKYLCKIATAGSKEARQLETLKHNFEKAYRESGEVHKNTAKNSGEDAKRYSISKTAKIPYNDQVKLIEGGKMNGSNSLYIGKPSEQLQTAGFSDAPFAMNQSDYRKSRRKSAKNSKYSSHAVPYDFFESMPKHIAESPLLIDNGVKVSVVTSYGMKDTSGKDSFVIAGVWRNQAMESDTINQVKSAYPLDDFIERITKAAETEKLVVTNKNKAEQMLATIGIQPSEVSRIISLARGTITQIDSDVKTKFSLSSEQDTNDIKQKQLDIINETNPMWDDYHTGIRTTDDIRTWDEVLESNDEREGQFVWGDFSRADAEQALKDGTITVYSSYPIKNGVFVSTSYIQAQEYAGGRNGKVYSKTIPLTDVAWINGDEGQYAKVPKSKIESNTRYSLSEDSEGREVGDAVQKRFANTKVVDENGRLKAVYHGTASGVFTIFDKSKGSVEGDFGSGFYFTDNEFDVSEHYEGGGPDFENKVGRRADQIWNENPDIEYEEAEARAYKELYQGSHKFEVYLNIENPAIVGETTLLSPDSYNEEYNIEDYDSEDDYYADVEQLFADDVENIIWEIERNVDVDGTDGIADILYNAYYEGGIDIESLKKKVNDLYLEDSEGNLVGNEVTRQIIESLGYDGIIDPTVSGKWNMDMEEGTTHYIVFKPNQIKSVTNQNPTDNPDINLSLSEEGAAPKEYGNFNIYGKDIRYRETPAQEAAESIAPVQEDLQTPAEDVAPLPVYEEPESEPTVYELKERKEAMESRILAELEKANETENYDTYNELVSEYFDLGEQIKTAEAAENAWNDGRIASLGDIDAPIEQEVYNDELQDPTPLPKTKVAEIARSVRKVVNLTNKDVAAIKEAIQKYSTSENPSREELYQAIEAVIGKDYEVVDDEIVDVRNFLRKYKLRVSDVIKGDIADYAHLMRSNVGKIRFSNEGLEVDTAYGELSELYPAFFPADITNPTEQFLKIIDVANLNKTYTEEYRPEFGAEMVNEVVDVIVNGVSSYKQAQTQKAAEDKAREISKAVTGEDIAPVAYEAIRPSRPIRPKRETQRSTEPRMIRVDSNNGRPGEKQRKWAGTSTESDAVDGKVLIEDLDQNKIHYQPISNKTTLGNANAKLNSEGYEESISYFNHQFKNNKVSLDDIALGERLIQEAIKRGDTKTAGELIQNVAILGTELGQKVQALSIIKRLTPEGQLMMLQKIVKRGKAKGDKAYDGVDLSQEMKDKILSSYNEDGSYDKAKLNEAVEDVKQQLADQMDVSKMDKVNAWRYLAMLGNPKTHIRNLVSNIAMKGTVAAKNAIARTVEDIAPVKNRTKTWKSATDEVKAFAQKTTEEMKDVISDGDKYSEDASIKAKRAIFKNKILNGLYEFNNDFLSKEDWWFSRPAFKNSLSEYLTANGIRTEQDIQNNPEVVEKAKQYAMEQSQIATFRQYSWLANQINGWERKNAAANVAIGAILPFKKTPINVAKAGLNYSPLGFAKTLTYDVSQVKNGKMEASELIDHLAQNITGTALTLVGYMLAKSGLISGGGEDDKEGDYDYQLGEQTYSVNIGGNSYSLSWLSPVAMPLFVGANAFEQLEEGKEWNGDVVVETLAQTLDPLNEMSFLSSLNQVLASYEGDMKYFAGMGQAMLQNYVTQFVPTLSSQFATVMDDTKRSTKVAGDSDFRFVDETVNKLKLKIPGLRETLEPSTDIWGNEIKLTDDVITRAIETFIAPYSKKDNIASEVDAEIKSLYREVGDNGLIPSIPDNYVNYKDEKHKMSANEYTEFKTAYGQNAYNLLEELFDSEIYQNASAEDKAAWVNDVYDYARDEAKRTFLAGKGVEYTNATKEGVEYYKENAIKGAIENNVTPDEYSFSVEYPEKYDFFQKNGITYEEYASADEDGKRAYSWAAENPSKYELSKAVIGDVVRFRKYTSELYDIRADYDSSGKAISGSSKAKKAEYINGLSNLDYGQKIILYRSLFDAQKDKDAYNADIVEYLNSRDDISYEQMVTILEELDMTVHSDGRVTW